jgi:cytochrome c556
MQCFFQTFAVLLSANFFVITAASMASAEDVDIVVKARMAAMKDIGSNMKSLAHIMRGREVFSKDKVKDIFANLEDTASRTPSLFETYAINNRSEAGTEIWENFDDFIQKAQDLQRVSRALEMTIETKVQLPDAMKSLGATCKACHSKYRN